eukprot:CAMPEP_0119301144 /NCGR_PEP_ID=MMETSP1333-20130426/2967_1 /TAXON_ID=418940 /ORGANISM="Scyphosphaera apsteinii, Strain RCC1455" /LENGTH=660 /DNA_ID=CAMNT_0007303139 /DNA_START=26 /DNA_END=2008 /DNA_ORIENTATION=-
MNTTVLQVWTGEDQPAYVQRSLCRVQRYSELQGYEYIRHSQRQLRLSYSAAWERIPQLIGMLGAAEWKHNRSRVVVYLDADLQVLDYERPVRELFQGCGRAELITTTDFNADFFPGWGSCCLGQCECAINTGVLIARVWPRSSSWAKSIFQEMLQSPLCKPFHRTRQWDQDCLQLLLNRGGHMPSQGKLLHAKRSLEPAVGPSKKICVLPQLLVAPALPFVDNAHPLYSYRGSKALRNALLPLDRWNASMPPPFSAHAFLLCNANVHRGCTKEEVHLQLDHAAVHRIHAPACANPAVASAGASRMPDFATDFVTKSITDFAPDGDGNLAGEASRKRYAWKPEWLTEIEGGDALGCLRNITFVVMTSSLSSSRSRLGAASASWLGPLRSLVGGRVLLMSDRSNRATGEKSTPVLYNRTTYLDAQRRHFVGLKLAYRSAELRGAAWTMLVDDDTWVNVPHLLRYVRRLEPSRPLVVSHILDRVWLPRYPQALSGGAGMLLSAEAFRRFGVALTSGVMPLPSVNPRAQVHNDEHMMLWAARLGVQVVHSQLFGDNALSGADARIIDVVLRDAGLSVSDYGDSRPIDAWHARAAAAVLGSSRVDPQSLGMLTLHRLPSDDTTMRTLQQKLEAMLNATTMAFLQRAIEEACPTVPSLLKDSDGLQ